MDAAAGHRADLPPELEGTERFEIRRKLGAGSFGVVYEAYDRERRCPVAVKWLSHVDADTVHRFKTEFRSLAEISHPNLVSLFDLESDGDRWFFSMELVRGVALPRYLRPDSLPPGTDTLRAKPSVSDVRPRSQRPPAVTTPSSPPEGLAPLDVSPREIRAVFSQLAQGVAALHESGKLHRDLKCQNVMVNPDGRVLLLDFGLVRELGPRTPTDDLDLAGTPLYMAPEQCAGAPVGQAADWYAVGVMLFRALTGHFPFEGRMYEVMANKQRGEAPRASSFVSDLPQDLDDLCAALLARRPDSRPSAAKVLSALGVGSGARPAFPSRNTEVFVGRRRELRALEAARRVVASGRPTAVYVHGASGIGKTALVRHFLSRLREAEPNALVLEGRCFERETLPYKALDSVIDDLAERLLGLPAPERDAVLPEHVSDLVRVFPALARVPSFREAASPLSEVPDPQEQRRRAIVGLHELLAGLSTIRSLVVFVDDLQWGDRDSAHMMERLLGTSDAPPVLWIGSYRSDEASSSPYLELLGIPKKVGERATLIAVPELDEEEARTLLELRLAGTARDEELLDGLARDAAGSPLLIDLLVRHSRNRGASTDAVDLSAVLAERMEELPEHGRGLLEVLAVRGQPMPQDVAAQVLGVESFDPTLVTQLRNARLLRFRERGGESELELYHDRIRSTVAKGMDAERELALHAKLARALRGRSDTDPESLAMHYRGAGDEPEAFHYTVEAARRAEAALAFDRAADLYRSALELRRAMGDGAPDRPDDGELRVGLGDALRNAGRGAESASAYLAAASASHRRKALELRRLAAEQYLFSGHLDEARAVLRSVLDAVGLSFPEHPARAIAEFLARRAQVRLRGLRFTERPLEEISEEDLLRIDVCWSISIGLAMIDPVRGGVFQARHLLMALDAGDPVRVARAVAVEVPFHATAGAGHAPRTRELMRIGQELAAKAGKPYNDGLLASSSGGAYWLEGDWERGRVLEEQALTILRQKCTGVAWELASSTIVLLDVLWRMGRMPELFERWPAVLADASSRGDLLLEIYVRIKFCSMSELAAGRPDEAVRDAQEALARWSQPTFQLLHFWELFVRVESKLYSGHPEAARERLDATWPSVRRSQLLQLQMYEVTYRDLEARVAVACAARASGRPRRALLKDAERAIARLEKTGAAWARGLATLSRAGVASVSGDARLAVREARSAERSLGDANMALHATIARCRAAELEGDATTVTASQDAMSGLALAEPDRWLALLAPGSWSA